MSVPCKASFLLQVATDTIWSSTEIFTICPFYKFGLRLMGTSNAALVAPVPRRAPPGSLPKATQTSLPQAPSAARVWAGVAAGRTGATVWANGATCCECLKHFDRQASWASRFLAKAEAEPALRKVQPLGVSPRGIALEKGTNGSTLQNRVLPRSVGSSFFKTWSLGS